METSIRNSDLADWADRRPRTDWIFFTEGVLRVGTTQKGLARPEKYPIFSGKRFLLFASTWKRFCHASGGKSGVKIPLLPIGNWE
jgi:hypothetical protein